MIEKNILFGVRGAGNAHLDRARLMAAEFAKHCVAVEYLFSGKSRDTYVDMGVVFNQALYKSGLTYTTHLGCAGRIRSLLNNKPLSYLSNLCALTDMIWSSAIMNQPPPGQPVFAKPAR